MFFLQARECTALITHCIMTESHLYHLSCQTLSNTAACALQTLWMQLSLAQFFCHTCYMQKSCPCQPNSVHAACSKKCLVGSLKKNEYAKKPWSDRPELAVWLFLHVEPDERPSPAWKAALQWWKGRQDRKGERGREGEEKSPSLALLEISTKGRDGGRVKQADCLESNKTRRLRGPGSSFGSFDWFQRIGLGPTRGESFKLLIVGSPSLKISVYSKHISLRSWLWPELIKVSKVAAWTLSVPVFLIIWFGHK